MLDRRKFLKKTATAGATAFIVPALACGDSTRTNLDRNIAKGNVPLSNLENEITGRVKKTISNPVVIDKIEVVKTKSRVFIRVTDKEGEYGVTRVNDKRLFSTFTMFKKLIAPFFLGKDARDIAHYPSELLRIDRNYKYVGLPFWNSVGIIEVAIWDLLGKKANKPVYQFLGEKVRDNYPVYISSLDRENPIENETDLIKQTAEATGATATKIKIGGRMKNIEPYITRTNQFVPYVRKTMGDDFTIYVDGNSSYTAEEAIEVLKMLESYDVKFFEEPCYWQDLWSHKLVKESATTCAIAGGEQDSSVDQFRLMCEIKAMDILQPDVFYVGGMIRALKVSYIAKEYGIGFTPHSPKAGPMAAAPNQLFAVCPVLTGHQEYRVMGHEKQKDWHTPVVPVNGKLPIFEKPGLGIEYNEKIWKKEEIIWNSKEEI
ncbi:mandelate racemase/muconate lactonizing enzyme family protein [Aquimarina celericrescens]|uniref:glucarate dehydratase n=1 Tax=Aquimarina celericrescens TaxID=1964542 RepID=A0ABW5AY05_9FLAO|nr:mandelate racemase/muconate lactonizing enzyme family protein [Aquimarina celericrescens]